jgi:hypothetical protein
MKAKTFIGLLNATLKGIAIVSGIHVDKAIVHHIAAGIVLSIVDDEVEAEFIRYVSETYEIHL